MWLTGHYNSVTTATTTTFVTHFCSPLFTVFLSQASLSTVARLQEEILY